MPIFTSHALDDSLLTELLDDDFEDRRPQRRRYEEPLAVTLRKQVLAIAESVNTHPLAGLHGQL